jgi:hypothetical protein
MGATNQRNDFVTGNATVTGDLIVGDDLTVDGDAAVTGSATAASFNGVLAGVTAPVEVAEVGADAADLWTALAALGLIVEPEA